MFGFWCTEFTLSLYLSTHTECFSTKTWRALRMTSFTLHHVTLSCLCMLFQSFSPRSSLCYSFAFTLFEKQFCTLLVSLWPFRDSYYCHSSLNLSYFHVISHPSLHLFISSCVRSKGEEKPVLYRRRYPVFFYIILRCPFVSEILIECNSDFRFHHSTENLPN